MKLGSLSPFALGRYVPSGSADVPFGFVTGCPPPPHLRHLHRPGSSRPVSGSPVDFTGTAFVGVVPLMLPHVRGRPITRSDSPDASCLVQASCDILCSTMFAQAGCSYGRCRDGVLGLAQ